MSASRPAADDVIGMKHARETGALAELALRAADSAALPPSHRRSGQAGVWSGANHAQDWQNSRREGGMSLDRQTRSTKTKRPVAPTLARIAVFTVLAFMTASEVVAVAVLLTIGAPWWLLLDVPVLALDVVLLRDAWRRMRG